MHVATSGRKAVEGGTSNNRSPNSFHLVGLGESVSAPGTESDQKSQALCDPPQSALEGSPPPELPNYACDSWAECSACKYIFSNHT